MALLALAPALVLAEPPDQEFLKWMDAIAQKQLDARAATIRAIHTTAGAAERQQYVRKKVLEEIGGLPDYDGPLNPRVTGELKEPGYIIEKVIFESLPHVYVTANLYRPDAPGRFPGVLIPLGHWDYGKPSVQRIAANLALKGFVALAYDPLGQGERPQLYDRRLEGSLAGGSTEQHLLAGGLSELIGQSFARYRIWDAKRALDYLVSRPEVLTDRIGCTGCSGGGTITAYISALDSRIKVAAPACYINSWRLLFSGPVGDSEQSFTGFLSDGLDVADYIELFAPKPWLISSTREDFFPLAGARMAYEEARQWYGIYDAQPKVKWAVGPGGHGTPVEIREAIYDWMIRWLKDGAGSAKEQEAPLFAEHQLWAAPNGQVSELPDSREVFDVLRDLHGKQYTAEPREKLVGMLRELISPPQTAPHFELTGQQLRIDADAGLQTSGWLIAPPGAGRKPAVLLVETKAALPKRAQELASQGNVVLVIIPRGLPTTEDPRRYSGDWLPNVRSWLIGRNLPAMRAHDILSGLNILAARDDVDAAHIRAEATGMSGLWLLMSAAVDNRIASVAVHNTPYSFKPAYDDPLTRDLHSAIIPGFALHWDIPDLVPPDRVAWIDPSDWLGHIVPLPRPYRYSPKAE